MDRLNQKLWLIFVATIAARFLFHLLTNFTFDDAYITYRYAENLIAGYGFVYNKGERVLGTTTPLFTLLLSIFTISGVKIQSASLLISLFASCATATLIYRIAQHLRFTHFAVLPVVVYILFPRLLVTDSSGMETALFTLFLAAGFYFNLKEKPINALAMATLASVTRPEGYLLLFLFLIYNGYKYKNEIGRFLLVPSLIIIPWLAFCYFYFGSVIPHSITAKLALYSRLGSMDIWGNLKMILALHNLFGWVMLLLAPVGLIWLWRKQNFGLLELIWLLGMIIPLTITKTHLFIWYVSPIYPIYLIFILAAVPYLFDRFNFDKRKGQSVSLFISIVLVAGLMFVNINNVRFYKSNQEAVVKIHESIGYYLKANGSENDLIAAEDIGYIGYISKLRILDRDGLVSPQAVPFNKSGEYFKLIETTNPDWVVASPALKNSAFIDSEPFLSLYKLEKVFKSKSDIVYNLYKKIS